VEPSPREAADARGVGRIDAAALTKSADRVWPECEEVDELRREAGSQLKK